MTTPKKTDNSDPFNIKQAFLELSQQLISNPEKLAAIQAEYWQNMLNIWQQGTAIMLGEDPKPLISPDKSDKRFKDKNWQENTVFDFIKQSYLLTSQFMQSTISDISESEDIDHKTAQKLDFYTKQFTNALSPSNFVLTNPKILEETIESKGENLQHGLQNLIDDLKEGEGQLKISMSDTKSFEIGKNLATTKGKIIYQNDLMQLIQYSPTTEKTYKTPMLIIPPWINKYYILDLNPEKSFVKNAIDNGHTTFIISWVNPTKAHKNKDFEDYMQEGALEALKQIEKQTGESQTNMVGYCIGGTLLAAMLGYLTAKGEAKKVKSATYLTTLIDFQDAGELSIFIDEPQIEYIESQMAEKGYLDGSNMAMSFNMLRSNDLIWSFVVNNYLLGRSPIPFDLLYWNSDSTRMPAAMHSFYLRNMYLNNLLSKDGGISLKDTKISLSKIKTPSYILATEDDHIAPWKSAYKATQIYSGDTRFTLSGSGHIAGVINPPSANKYGYYTNDKTPKDPTKWLESATKNKASWWQDWQKWLKPKSGKKIPARKIKDGKLTPIESAPGSYVKTK